MELLRRCVWCSQRATLLLGKRIGYGALGRLYGLVQAGRTWNEELNGHMESKESTATVEDSAIYVKNYWMMQDFAIAGFWVDNCIATGSRKEIESLAKGVYVKYGITGLEEGCWMLSMTIII